MPVRRALQSVDRISGGWFPEFQRSVVGSQKSATDVVGLPTTRSEVRQNKNLNVSGNAINKSNGQRYSLCS